ncbi:MAG: hypothetical protein ACLVC4_05750, partial [Gordonibacter urolithinfaciens]
VKANPESKSSIIVANSMSGLSQSSQVHQSQREALTCPGLPRFAAERACAREGKRKRGKAGCVSASQRRAVSAAGGPPKRYRTQLS